VSGEGAGLVVEAVVELGLATAGLGGGAVDGAAEVLEQSDRGQGGLGIVTVGQAGGKERYLHGGIV